MNRLLLLLVALQLLCLIESHRGGHGHRFRHRDRKRYDSDCSEESFKEYQKDFRKRSDKHDGARRKRLCDKITEIEQLNKKNLTFEVEVNEFTDMTPEEYSHWNGVDSSLIPDVEPRSAGPVKRSAPDDCCEVDILDVPESLDWRDHGIVSPVKYQGSCGSCWAFASVGSMESIAKKKYGANQTTVTLLSEQQLVDCTRPNGCKGGWPQYAFEYLAKTPGITTSSSYPYTQTNNTCAYNSNMETRKVMKSIEIPKYDAEAIKTAVATVGPVTVALDATGPFNSYNKGVYNWPGCQKNNFTHVVLIVGYGTDETDGAYWIAKNSWGTNWGDGGYFNIARGTNMCGIETWAAYPDM